jgi:hypothetical protein
MRNDFAHELYRWVLDDSVPPLDKAFINVLINLYFRVSNWWAQNLKAGVDPESWEKYSQGEMGSAMAFNVQVLMQLLDRVFPKESKE